MHAPPTFDEERRHAFPVAGVDEAGRGPLAGPVVAAAVILDPDCLPQGLADSKTLCRSRREEFHGTLLNCARIGVGRASVEEIDRINIFWAAMLAMERAVEALGAAPAMVLIDGNAQPRWARPTRTIVKGDAKCLSIAAASIVAKVTRDQEMERLASAHPVYGWERNKGYATAEHRAALCEYGPTPHHRRSFAPVAQQELRLKIPG